MVWFGCRSNGDDRRAARWRSDPVHSPFDAAYDIAAVNWSLLPILCRSKSTTVNGYSTGGAI
jgi:hypothetical protein